MASKNYVKLIMVTSENNNKYYEMTYTGGSTFTVKYGRVESTAITKSYPYSKWDSIYNEKVGKGYKDVTDMVSVKVKEEKKQEHAPITIKAVNDFITKMKGYTDELVSSTYSVKCTSVSKAQVDTAQGLIDTLSELSKSKKQDVEEVNKTLISLYTTIPRYMGKVQDHILPGVKLGDILQDEQDKLDAMAGQVSIYNDVGSTKKVDGTRTLLDVMGIIMTEAKDDKPSDIRYLLRQMKESKIHRIFEVNKPKEDADFEEWKNSRKDKSSKILLHGTKCTSVIPILEIGLKIRPPGNFQFSGKAYGNGNYFSEVVDKSLGYTGWEKDKILLVYEVHTGNPFVYDGWYKGNSFSLSLTELTKRGFDSTYVKAGNGLLNSEIIAYSEKQNRIKYIIWLKD